MPSVVRQWVHDAKIAPLWALLFVVTVAFAVLMLGGLWDKWKAATYHPFVGLEVSATQDDEMVYYSFSGRKVVATRIVSQTTSFVVNGSTYSTPIYRPDGTLHVPSPVIATGDRLNSPVFRVFIPTIAYSDPHAALRLCWSYEHKPTWCHNTLLNEIPERDGAIVESGLVPLGNPRLPDDVNGVLDLISPQFDLPRQIAPLQ